MPKDKDTYKAVHQALTEVVLPQLEALRAEIRQLNDRLDARPAPATATSDLTKEPERWRTVGLLSEQGSAYIESLVQAITAKTERDAAAWAEQNAKNPEKKP